MRGDEGGSEGISLRRYYGQRLLGARRELAKLVREHVVIEGVLTVVGALVGFALSPEGVERAVITVGTAAVAFLATIGILACWVLAWAPVNSDRQKSAAVGELRRALAADMSYRGQLAEIAQLIREGMALIESTLTTGDNLLNDRRAEVRDWRARATQFIKEYALAHDQDAAHFEHAFSRGQQSFLFNGATYSGDRGVLASQIQEAVWALQSITIPQPWFGIAADISG